MADEELVRSLAALPSKSLRSMIVDTALRLASAQRDLDAFSEALVMREAAESPTETKEAE